LLMRYRVTPIGATIRQWRPVSSNTSRTAVSSGVSPLSAFPLGRPQSSYRGRWATNTFSFPLADSRKTRPPAAWMTRVTPGRLERRYPKRLRGSGPDLSVGAHDRLREQLGAGEIDGHVSACLTDLAGDPATDALGLTKVVASLAAAGAGLFGRAVLWPQVTHNGDKLNRHRANSTGSLSRRGASRRLVRPDDIVVAEISVVSKPRRLKSTSPRRSRP